MRLFYSTDHDSVWVGGASIVLANTPEEARELLTKELASVGLDKRPEFTLIEVATAKPQAIILRDGDY